jgi:hypothetical protein
MTTSSALDDLLTRRQPDGGFLSRIGMPDSRPDATAWAVLACRAAGADAATIEAARIQLTKRQHADGAVPVSPEHPKVYWPTALALLAWHGWAPGAEAAGKALTFLEETSSIYMDNDRNVQAIDTRLKGWSWIAGTSSWVEPTSLALFACEAHGRENARTQEARRVLADRELPKGGWNYGSTLVFGTELFPTEESVGVALTGLAGLKSKPDGVPRSLQWLETKFPELRTPFTLAWGILGLAAWDRRPASADGAIAKCLARQSVLGPYETTHLALLEIAARCPRGLKQLFLS